MSASEERPRGPADRPGPPTPDHRRGPHDPRPSTKARSESSAAPGRVSAHDAAQAAGRGTAPDTGPARRPRPGLPHGTPPQSAAPEGRRQQEPATARLAAERGRARGPRETYRREARTEADTPDRTDRTARFRAPKATRSNALHAGAWWLWALGLAVAASRTTNPLLLLMLVAVAGYVVAARRTDSPWARSYGAFLKLGLLVLAIRLVFAFVLGTGIPGTHVLVHLPEVPLPDWAQGLRIGGRVMAEEMLFALYEGLRLATLLVCLGAANALANPARLLKSLPGALYEVGVAVVVAMTFAPNLVADVLRLRAARRLRGRDDRGVGALLQIGLPVLEDALQRSVALAATMDTRGYGRTAQVPAAVRHTTTALTLGGLLGVCAGSYALLSATGASYGTPLLACGFAAALGGLWLGGRRSVRSHYRPDAWGVRAWLVAGSGAAVAALTVLAAGELPTAALQPPVVPPTAPTLPLWPAGALLIGLLPAFVAPAPRGAQARPAASQEVGDPTPRRRHPRAGRPAAPDDHGPNRRPRTPSAGAPGRSPEDPGRGGAGEDLPPRRRATDAARDRAGEPASGRPNTREESPQ